MPREHAVDHLARAKIGNIVRSNASSIQNRNGFVRVLLQFLPDPAVHIIGVCWRACSPVAALRNRPYRLVRDQNALLIRERQSVKRREDLFFETVLALSGFAILGGLSDAQNRNKPCIYA